MDPMERTGELTPNKDFASALRELKRRHETEQAELAERQKDEEIALALTHEDLATGAFEYLAGIRVHSPERVLSVQRSEEANTQI